LSQSLRINKFRFLEINMVYCSKCGVENPDVAKYCSKCGADLKALQTENRAREWGEEFGEKMENWGEEFGRNVEKWGEGLGKNIENECFGLPHGGAIIGIIFGAFIVIIGASLALGLDFDVWGRYFGTGILIIIGLFIVIGSIYGLSRRRR
jgi:ribosomal protein L40E